MGSSAGDTSGLPTVAPPLIARAPAGDVIIHVPNTLPSPLPVVGTDPPNRQQQLDQALVKQQQPPSQAPVEQQQPPSQAPADQQQQLGRAPVEQQQPVSEVVVPTCEVQINNLVDLQIEDGVVVGPQARKKLVLREALREWKEAQSGLEGKVERRTKQTDKIIYEIYQLVGLYSVFVGVVFTAAVQSQNLKCQHIWSPVLLCVFAWLIIISVTRNRLKNYKALCATIKTEDRSRAAFYEQIGKLKSYGLNAFDFRKHAQEKEDSSNTELNLSPFKICGVRVSASWVIPVVVTALTLILIASFMHIMCYK